MYIMLLLFIAIILPFLMKDLSKCLTILFNYIRFVIIWQGYWVFLANTSAHMARLFIALTCRLKQVQNLQIFAYAPTYTFRNFKYFNTTRVQISIEFSYTRRTIIMPILQLAISRLFKLHIFQEFSSYIFPSFIGFF